MNRLLRSPAHRRLAALSVSVVILSLHFVWINVFQESEPAQAAWLNVPAAGATGWWDRYWTGEHFWLGYSYALSFGFAVYALLLYASSRLATTGRLAVGGMSLSGFLAVGGCFLVGCCGSPMLGVYLSLFGASFLPFAKPLVATVTTVLITASWLWLRSRQRTRPASDCC